MMKKHLLTRMETKIMENILYLGWRQEMMARHLISWMKAKKNDGKHFVSRMKARNDEASFYV